MIDLGNVSFGISGLANVFTLTNKETNVPYLAKLAWYFSQFCRTALYRDGGWGEESKTKTKKLISL